jgi:dTDP-4-amino-4,6-dideoxygalactose transaminase
MSMSKLAVNGGERTRTGSFPKWPIFDERDEAALLEAFRSGCWGIGGSITGDFAARFAAYHGAKYGLTTCNGTVSLVVALRALGVGPGDEVIVPAYTFLATASAVLEVDAVPIFVDIHPDTYCLDPEMVAKAITPRTKAIIPVHLAGHPADMDRIMELARKHELVVLEDSAQAHGAEWRGQRVGSIGDMGSFSFQSSKNLNCGEGGAVITNNEELFDKSYSFHNCGRKRGGAKYQHHVLGQNFRLSQLQAAVLMSQMDRLDEQTDLRNENGKYLSGALSQIEGIRPLAWDERVTRHGYHLYIFRYDSDAFNGVPRETFMRALAAEGIPCSKGYVPLYREELFVVNSQDCPLGCGFYGGKVDYSKVICPVTEKAADSEAVWLQQNILLGSKADMDSIVDAIYKIRENVHELK